MTKRALIFPSELTLTSLGGLSGPQVGVKVTLTPNQPTISINLHTVNLNLTFLCISLPWLQIFSLSVFSLIFLEVCREFPRKEVKKAQETGQPCQGWETSTPPTNHLLKIENVLVPKQIKPLKQDRSEGPQCSVPCNSLSPINRMRNIKDG